jgi:hypothetical protein
VLEALELFEVLEPPGLLVPVPVLVAAAPVLAIGIVTV